MALQTFCEIYSLSVYKPFYIRSIEPLYLINCLTYLDLLVRPGRTRLEWKLTGSAGKTWKDWPGAETHLDLLLRPRRTGLDWKLTSE